MSILSGRSRRASVTTLATLAIAAVVGGSPAHAAATHTVESGDTLSGIANEHSVSLQGIFTANGLGWSSVIYPGDRISLDGTSVEAPAPAASSEGTHTVVPGDTLSGIAHKYGVGLSTLFSLNSMNGATTIYPGQVIRTAGTAEEAQAPAAAAPTIDAPAQVQPHAAAEEDVFIPGPDVTQLTGGYNDVAAVQQLVADTAAAMGVDQALAMAVAEQESHFNQNAFSGAGAIGIMQVMPNTGTWASELVGRNLDLYSAADNVTAGVAILYALQRTSANFDEAIASYYQGQGSVQSIGMYDDTIAYVESVKARMATFQ